MKKENLVRPIITIAIGLIFFVGVNYLFADWNGPTGYAPDSNVSAPINVSTSFQSKGGGENHEELFNVNGGFSSNSLGVFGPVTIAGSLKIIPLSNTTNSNICATAEGILITCAGGPTNNLAVTTAEVSQINKNTATCGGEVTNEGGNLPVTRGVVWSNTSTSPTVSLPTKTNDGQGLGSFVSSITGLSASTTYYVRAYVTDSSSNTQYGSSKQFTTTSTSWTAPTLATTAVTGVTGSTATTGGSFTGGSGVSVVEKGIQKSTDGGFTFSNINPNSGSGIATFTTNLTGLTVNTTYWVRAYAITNIAGTIYGNQVQFTTTGGSVCGGYKPAPGNFGSEYCWYVANPGQSCTAFCSSRGSSCNQNGNWNDSSSCEIGRHFYPSLTCQFPAPTRNNNPQFSWNSSSEQYRHPDTSLSCSALPFTGQMMRLCACME